MWIDSHCHLDAAEFDRDRDAVRLDAKRLGVGVCVIPAVQRGNFDEVRTLAHRYGDVYALGIHPLYVAQATLDDLVVLEAQLSLHKADPRLVAVGEIGLDYFVPDLCTDPMRARQWHFYTQQLLLAKRYDLPVIVHVRKSCDQVLKGLRDVGWTRADGTPKGGIAHAFNGSWQQAEQFIALGFKLGFGGALTYDRATHIRQLAAQLPLDAIVLETDAPDIVPQWLYVTAAQRAQGEAWQNNTPAQLPRIGQVLADVRGVDAAHIARQTTANVHDALVGVGRLALNEPAPIL